MPPLILPLARMSVAEKLGAMEQIWESLRQDDRALVSPRWHADVLKARKQAVESGTARFVEWAEAKDEIRRRVRS